MPVRFESGLVGLGSVKDFVWCETGYTTSYAYDDMGRMVRIACPSSSEETYGYDVSGLLIEAVNADAEVSFKRDIMGRIIKESSHGHVINSTCNLQGRRTRLTSTLGADIEASYNPFGDLENMETQAGLGDEGIDFSKSIL